MLKCSGKKWIMALLLFVAVVVVSPAVVNAQGAASPEVEDETVIAGGDSSDRGLYALAIAIAITGACAGAGYAVARVGAAALGAASENPDMLMRSLLYVALAEGIAIYGLLVAMLLWMKL